MWHNLYNRFSPFGIAFPRDWRSSTPDNQPIFPHNNEYSNGAQRGSNVMYIRFNASAT